MQQPKPTSDARPHCTCPQVHNTTLTSLDLSGIGLKEFPKQLGRLTGLTALNLSKNALEAFPQELGLLTGLQQLAVHGNPLRSPFGKVGRGTW